MRNDLYSMWLYQLAGAGLALVMLASSACSSGSSQGTTRLEGSGATFPQPLYEDWAFTYHEQDPAVFINYAGGGSGQGIKDIKSGAVDFAGSDAALKDSDYAQSPDLQMIPTVAGAVVLAYNVKGVSRPLVLDGSTVADIYLGKIERWNDPALARLNPGVALPDQPINVVHRSDGSGTTNIFTLYLSAVNADWKKSVGSGTAVDWPVDKLGRGQGGKGNPGVAAAVRNTEGSLGYVELGYAQNNDIPYADQINAAGQTVKASVDSTTEAIRGAQFNDRLAVVIVNSPNPKAWPIAGFTYLIVHKSYTDCVRADKLVKFIHWALTDRTASAHASQLLYAPLPAEAQPRIINTLDAIQCNGQPLTGLRLKDGI